MSIYLKMQGISGSVTSQVYANWIPIHSAELNIRLPVSQMVGNMNRRVGTARATDMLISKISDRSSPFIFQQACVGNTALDEVQIHFCQNNDHPYCEYTLHNVLVSGYLNRVISLNEQTLSEELISLNFTELETRFIPYDAAGKAQAPVATIAKVSSSKSGFTASRKTGRLKFYWVADGWLIPLCQFNPPHHSINFNDFFDADFLSSMKADKIFKPVTAGIFSIGTELFNDATNYRSFKKALLCQVPKIIHTMPIKGGILIHVIIDSSRVQPNWMNIISVYPAAVITGHEPYTAAKKNSSRTCFN